MRSGGVSGKITSEDGLQKVIRVRAQELMKSPRKMCWKSAAVVFFSPFLCMPISALLKGFGCDGNEGVGIQCPPILGVDFSSIATLIFLYSAWGTIFAFPLGVLLFIIGFTLPNKPRTKTEPKQPSKDDKDDDGFPPDYYQPDQMK